MRTELRWGRTLQKLASAAGFVAVSLEDLRRLSTKFPTFHPNGHFADLILDPCTGKVNGQMASWLHSDDICIAGAVQTLVAVPDADLQHVR